MALVHRRAQLLRDASPAGCAMLAVTGAGVEAIERARGGDVHVAIEVDDDHHILAGPEAFLRSMGEALVAAGAAVRHLPVTVPSHTPLLAAAAEALREHLQEVPGRAPDCMVLRGVDGRALFSHAGAADAIADAVRMTIRWKAVQQEIAERGITLALELPPGAGLTRMFAGANAGQARAVADFRSVEGVASWLGRML